MDNEKKYSAFISYRHLPLDENVAVRVQNMLESYRQPRGVAEGKKIGRIFRDTTELPMSEDLGDAIQTALSESEFLIVILSEHTKESAWCMKELHEFKRLHGGDASHILPVLVSGGLPDVIPEEMRFDEISVVDEPGQTHISIREREPILADIRGDSDRERIRKLKTEFLRLAAPILGCGFDDLYQRHRKRKKKRILAFSCVLASIVLGYAGIMIRDYRQISEKNRELERMNLILTDQKRELQKNASKLFAEKAEEALNEGNYPEAFEYAYLAIPEDSGEEQTYSVQAERVLMKGLPAFGAAEQVDYSWENETVFRQETPVLDLRLSGDGEFCYSIDRFGTVQCFRRSGENREWKVTLPFDTEFGADRIELLLSEKYGKILVKARQDDPNINSDREAIWTLDSRTGEILSVQTAFHAESGTMILSGDEAKLAYLTAQYSALPFYQCHFLDMASGEWTDSFPIGTEEDYGELWMYPYGTFEGCFAADDSSIFAGVYYKKRADGIGYDRHFYTIDLYSRTTQEVYVDCTEDTDVLAALRYLEQEHAFTVVSGELQGDLEIICLDTEKRKVNWKTRISDIWDDENGKPYNLWEKRGGEKTLFDGEDILISCGKKLYAVRPDDSGSDAVIAEYVFPNRIREFHRIEAEDYKLYGVVLEDGTAYAMLLSWDHVFYEVGSESIGQQIRMAAALNDGIFPYEAEDSEGHEEKNKAENVLAYVPGGANADVIVLRSVSMPYQNPWTPTEIYSYGENERWIPCGWNRPVLTRNGTVSFLLQKQTDPEQSGDSHIYKLITVDLDSMERTEREFRSPKDLESGDSGSKIRRTVIPNAEGTGMMIDDGLGSLLYVDTETGRLSVLCGTEDRSYDLFYNPGTQGEFTAAGTYVMAATDRNGAAIGAQCDGDVLRIWTDQSEKTQKLPDGMIWQRSIDHRSYRILYAGENGFILLSDFSSSSNNNELEHFVFFSTESQSWYQIEDESHGRADRAVALANQEPLFAAADSDQCIRVYRITDEACINRISLPVPANALGQIGFSQDDNYLYAATEGMERQIFLFRVADGELVYRMTPNGTNNYAEISVTTDEENQRLYIQFISSYPQTHCISTATWEELGAPEYAAAFLPETGELLCTDSQHLYLIKVPSRDELVETAVRFVEMSRTHT